MADNLRDPSPSGEGRPDPRGKPVMPRRRSSLAVLLTLVSVSAFTGCECGSLDTVAPPTSTVSSVAVSPATDTLVVGDTRTFTAIVRDTAGAVIPGAAVSWSSHDPAVITVTASGLVTALGEGVTHLVASSGGRADTAVVAVVVRAGWYIQTSGTTNDLHGVAFRTDGRVGVAVGATGAIVRTDDAGASWAIRPSGTTAALRDAWFVSASGVFAVGDAGTIMRSRDAGVTWTRVLGVPTTDALRGVCFVDTARGWAVGANGTVLRTVDGGANWTRLNPTSATLNAVSFPDAANGWAVGESGVIVGTRNGGASWSVVQPSVTGQSLRGVSRRSVTRAVAGGFAGVQAFTVAAADSAQWALGSFGATNTVNAIQLVDDLVGFAVGTNGSGLVLRTTDGGATWAAQVSGTAVPLADVWFVDALRGWAVGTGGRIIHTSRGGL